MVVRALIAVLGLLALTGCCCFGGSDEEPVEWNVQKHSAHYYSGEYLDAQMLIEEAYERWPGKIDKFLLLPGQYGGCKEVIVTFKE